MAENKKGPGDYLQEFHEITGLNPGQLPIQTPEFLAQVKNGNKKEPGYLGADFDEVERRKLIEEVQNIPAGFYVNPTADPLAHLYNPSGNLFNSRPFTEEEKLILSGAFPSETTPVVNFHEAKAEKEGIKTPRAVIENLLANIDSVESVIFVAEMKGSEELKSGWSNKKATSLIGMLECGKIDVLETILVGEE